MPMRNKDAIRLPSQDGEAAKTDETKTDEAKMDKTDEIDNTATTTTTTDGSIAAVVSGTTTSTRTRDTPGSEKEAVGVDGNDVRLQDMTPAGSAHEDPPSAPPPVAFRAMSGTRLMALVGMAFLWTSAQIPLYFWGGIPPLVYTDLGGDDRWLWFITGNLLASAAVCPFVGALSDLLGRRYVGMLGCAFIVVGQLVCTFAHTMNTFIAGMTLSGVGTGINELTALSGAAEIAPTRHRGIYVGFVLFSVLPFVPSVLWANLIAHSAGWRYVGVLCAVYAFAGLLILAVFYHPPPRANAAGLGPRQILARIDAVGGFLSVGGCTLFVGGMLWGGYQYPWGSAHVVAPLVLGLAMVAAFVAWELKGAAFPMVPRRLVGHHHAGCTGPPPKTRTMVLALLITCVSGANFFSVLMLWPPQAYNMYGHGAVGVGLRGLPFPTALLFGSMLTLAIITRRKGGNRWLLFTSSAIMTAGCGALAAARLDNIGAVYVILTVAGFGVGGILVPASLVAMVVCPEDLIATAAALTFAVRVIGGALGYAAYYNVFAAKLVPNLKDHLIPTVLAQLSKLPPNPHAAPLNVTDLITNIIVLTAQSRTEQIADLVPVGGADSDFYHAVILSGQEAYAKSYPYVYYVSIAFGVISTVASLFMEDIGPFMDDHVSVVIG